MEIAQIVLEYFKALAWPVIVVVALLRFAPAIRTLLGRLSEISSPDGFTARFDREVGETVLLAEEAATTQDDSENRQGEDDIGRNTGGERVAERVGLSQQDVADWAQVATRMARVRPVAMMLEGWSKLEALLVRSAATWRIDIPGKPLGVGEVAGLLSHMQAKGLAPDFFRVGVELAVLKQELDKIIEAGRTPSASSAQDFITASAQLMKAVLDLPAQET
ncbi:hypothetical protein [Nonomuraea ceibae]|uniref:hypothetical protein n=1 Tax=Nonomuraea ceibae TaxID=1935170 RepID=UPI001C5EB368|nr:hypothetical protein [Nonomuraea ceibae]